MRVRFFDLEGDLLDQTRADNALEVDERVTLVTGVYTVAWVGVLQWDFEEKSLWQPVMLRPDDA